MIGNNAVDLFRHGAIETSESRFHMRHRDVQFGSGEAPASVEFVSPYTSTQSGLCSMSIASIRASMRPVCWPWLPEPTSRSLSGLGISSSSKKTCDIMGS